MFEPKDLDPREQEIYNTADSFAASRFRGSGGFDNLGPFSTQGQLIEEIQKFFAAEDLSTLPFGLASRPFALYAISSKLMNGQVMLGTLYRDGKERLTSAEVSKRRQEERERNRRSARGNAPKV